MKIQTHNDKTDEDALDVPQVTFLMPSITADLSVQSAEEADRIQKVIEASSPFSVGRQTAELFALKDHGTAIYIWNLE